jgi:DNA-directed RNA polymerase specialized sigma24 family protein
MSLSPIDLLYSDPCFKNWLHRRGVDDPEDLLQEAAIKLLTETLPPGVSPHAACFVRLKNALSKQWKRSRALKRSGTVAIEDLEPLRKGMLS